MTELDQTVDDLRYLPRTAERVGVTVDPAHPPVRRETTSVDSFGEISALCWGPPPATTVAVHGGGQNAHSWDAFALAHGSPLLAIDLPGHGHSSWRADRDYSPQTNAEALAAYLDGRGLRGVDYVGMSLGGLTGIALAAARPDLVRTLTVVDVTPGVRRTYDTLDQGDRGTTVLVRGPRTFATFDELVDETHRSVPSRPRETVAIGAYYNAREDEDGRWSWRYDLLGSTPQEAYDRLWESLERIEAPVLFVRGGRSQFVSDEDAARFLRTRPDAASVTVEDAGHAVQGDQPVVLANLMRDFVEGAGVRR